MTFVTRGEKWVHETAQECLENIKVFRQRRVNKMLEAYREDMLSPGLWNLWFVFGEPKDTSDEAIRKYIMKGTIAERLDLWAAEEAYSKAFDVLQSLVEGTDIDMTTTVQVSIEASTVLEYWSNK